MDKVQTKRGEKCPACGRFYDRRVVTDALIVHEGKIVLIKRGIAPSIGWWALPGGHLDWDETAEESAMREAQEETGLQVKVRKFLGVYSKPDRDGDIQNVALAYVVDVIGGELHRQESEIADVRWFSLDDLPEQIAFDHVQMIADYKQSLNDALR